MYIQCIHAGEPDLGGVQREKNPKHASKSGLPFLQTPTAEIIHLSGRVLSPFFSV